MSPSQRPLPAQDNTTYKHKSQTSMPQLGFEPAIPATKRPQTYALDRAATGIGDEDYTALNFAKRTDCERWDMNRDRKSRQTSNMATPSYFVRSVQGTQTEIWEQQVINVSSISNVTGAQSIICHHQQNSSTLELRTQLIIIMEFTEWLKL
jgi:hypothetical protein